MDNNRTRRCQTLGPQYYEKCHTAGNGNDTSWVFSPLWTHVGGCVFLFDLWRKYLRLTICQRSWVSVKPRESSWKILQTLLQWHLAPWAVQSATRSSKLDNHGGSDECGDIVVVDAVLTLRMLQPYQIEIFTWVFPKIAVPQNGWFMVKNTIKMDDLGVPL